MSMDSEREAALVREARSGDLEAFLQLAREYVPLIHRLAFAVTLRDEEARALTADALRRARVGISRIPTGKRYLPWVLRLVRNLAVTRARRQGGQPGQGSPCERNVVDRLRALEPDERMALGLRIGEQLPYQDMAELLDQPLSVMLLRLAGARAALVSWQAPANGPGGGIHLTPQQMSAHLDHELSEASAAIVERHLAACDDCAGGYRKLEELEAALAIVFEGSLGGRGGTESEHPPAGDAADDRTDGPPPGEPARERARAAWWVGAAALLLIASGGVVVTNPSWLHGWIDVAAARLGPAHAGDAARVEAGPLSQVAPDDPRWIEEAVAIAERAAARADQAASADGFDTAAKAWEAALPGLHDSPEDARVARREVARARFRAWELAATSQRALAADSAIRAFLFDEPDGPDRAMASAWLARVGR